MSSPIPGKRLVQLDVLRGLAILLVLLAHFDGPPGGAGALAACLRYLRQLGPSGVDLFFVLSGFLVGGLLLDELRRRQRIDVRRFLIRRMFKIWPSYFVFVAFIGLWLLWKEHRPPAAALRALLPNLLHVQNYLGSAREHTWSLAVEEHFYLALPVLLALLPLRLGTGSARIPSLPRITLVVLLGCALLRLHAYSTALPFNPHFATHLRLDSLLLGVLLAYYHRFQPGRLWFARAHAGKVLVLSAAALFASPAVILFGDRSPFKGALVFVMFYLAYSGLLLVLVHATPGQGFLGRRLQGLPSRALRFVGLFSYPIYLWHLDAVRPVVKLLERGLLRPLPAELGWSVGFAIYVLSAVAGGVLFGVLIERPALALRERLFPARRAA
jgi:peptidoglycan/LPS O-acetylase OafA/YrhL